MVDNEITKPCPLCGGSGYVKVVGELPRNLMTGKWITVDKCPLCSNKPTTDT